MRNLSGLLSLRGRTQRSLFSLFVGASVILAANPAAAERSKQRVFTDQTKRARAELAKMTLDEKIGQMMQPDQDSLATPADIETYHLGSLLSGGGSGPASRADYNLYGWTELIESYQQRALKTRLAIPLLYGIDAVHGHNNIPGAVIFPHNIGMGCANDPELLRRAARVTAEEVRATGINWDFAPCVTVPQDIRWGRTYEGYSDAPAIVAPLAGAAVSGLQGDNLSDPLSVLACAKHFIGDGGTTYGTSLRGRLHALDQGDTRVDEATLRAIHMQGYVSAIQAGVGTIMPSYSMWNGVRCSASKALLTDLLKRELGFEGFLISDYNAIDEIGPDYKKDIEISVNAGMDMVMMTGKYPIFFKDLKELVGEGKVPMSRIDDAVTRILRVKIAMGLLDKNRSVMADHALHATFGSPEHRWVARRAARESQVLLKNDAQALPLSRTAKRIHLCGRGADNVGMQCGGWTIGWQGRMGQNVPGATSILSAVKSTASKDTQVTYSLDGTGAEGSDVAVVVIGETPYAEGRGDSNDLSIAKEDADTIANVKKSGVPMVVVLLSGRPLILGSALTDSNALIAAWLPGSEGQGVADVLFGDYTPTGKLSYAWPRDMSQLPLRADSPDPLFPVGYGLTYKKDTIPAQ